MSPSLGFLKQSKFCQLCFFITFFTSGIIVNFVQCILYLTLKRVNKRLYRKINWYLCATIYEQIAFIGDYWANINIQLYVDKNDYDRYFGKEHAFCILNHAFEIDWLLSVLIAERIKLLGNCKAYIKRALQYLPVLGWAWKFSDFVILERSFEKDKDVINKQIKELTEYPDPMWLLLFPEGTRFTPTKHRTSEAFAKEKNLTQLKYHLQPRTRGFITSLTAMKGKVPAIYDVLLAFNDTDPVKPTMKNLMTGRPVTTHMYIRRIPMEDVPTSEAGQEQFLRDMFVQKDKMRDSFVQTGNFFTTSGVVPVKPFRSHRRIYPLLNMIVWASLILYPILHYVILLLFSGNLVDFSIGISIIVFFIGVSYKMIGTSKISKGSSYGAVKVSKKPS